MQRVATQLQLATCPKDITREPRERRKRSSNDLHRCRHLISRSRGCRKGLKSSGTRDRRAMGENSRKKLAGSVCAMTLVLCAAKPQDTKFLNYKSVEAYEIRPGILAMPRYSDDGQLCEIGLETRHYTPSTIYLDSDLSRVEVGQIADELAPANERGPRTMGDMDLIVEVGCGITTTSAYENVSIQIYSAVSAASKKPETVADDVAATIKWTNRKCQ
jgi:hypothetical protein